jgi:predicted TIM-barrel fold metal-dependent hydrolase
MQAVSITPQTFLYDQDASLNATLARIQNEAIAKLTKPHPDRFLGLATLPMRAPSTFILICQLLPDRERATLIHLLNSR